jgi:hypothetical protein
MSKKISNLAKSSRMGLRNFLINICSSNNSTTLIDETLLPLQKSPIINKPTLRKQLANVRLPEVQLMDYSISIDQMPLLIVSPDRNQQQRPEQIIKHGTKLTSTFMLDDEDEEEDEEVQLSQISSSHPQCSSCVTDTNFFEEGEMVVMVVKMGGGENEEEEGEIFGCTNPLYESKCEDEEEDQGERVDLVSWSNAQTHLDSFGFDSADFKTANSQMFFELNSIIV